MKRIIRSTSNSSQFGKPLPDVSGIIFVEDARIFEFEDIFGVDSTDIPESPSTYLLKPADVQEILNRFKKCESIMLPERRRTLINQHLNVSSVTKQDLVNIAHQLTLQDYTRCLLNSNEKHLGNRLIEFITNRDFELECGEILSGVKVYIKINLDDSDSDTLAAVSFHSTKSYGKHPYTDVSN